MSEPDVAEDVVEEVEEVTADPLEEIAREWGWTDKDEWSGDEDSWVDAPTFVRKEREIRDKKSSDNRDLRHEIQKLHSKMEDLAINETKRLKEALASQKARLLKEREEAVDEGDRERFRQIDSELKDVEKKEMDVGEHEAKEETTGGAPKEVIDAFNTAGHKFASSNPWYGTDVEMTAEFNMYAEKLGATKQWQAHEADQYYEMVLNRMRRSFPDKFTNPNKSKPSAVGGERSGSSGKTAWDRLMADAPEAKKTFNHFVEKGIYKDTKADRERYAKLALEDE